MLKAKAWLHSEGHIATAGRGRPPKVSKKDGREITSILLEATKSGVKFSDWPKGKVEVTESQATESAPAETTVKVIRDATGSSANIVAELAPYRFTEEEFKAVEKGTKVERSLRSACNGCGVSLVICHCPVPRIVARDGGGSVEVTIVRKK